MTSKAKNIPAPFRPWRMRGEGERKMDNTRSKSLTEYGLPDGEIRLTRKKWPKNSSPVVVNIVFEGLVFTVAQAQIVIGVDGKPKARYVAEGISRVSPLDEEKRNPVISREHAIQQAISALHTRVVKHRRSFHHYRG